MPAKSSPVLGKKTDAKATNKRAHEPARAKAAQMAKKVKPAEKAPPKKTPSKEEEPAKRGESSTNKTADQSTHIANNKCEKEEACEDVDDFMIDVGEGEHVKRTTGTGAPDRHDDQISRKTEDLMTPVEPPPM